MAVSIFAILTLFVIDIYMNISRVYLGSLSARSVQENVRVALENVTRYIKQARAIDEIDSTQGKLSLEIVDENNKTSIVSFKKECIADPYARDDFLCNGQAKQIGVIKSSVDLGDYKPLTSTNLNITKFDISPSPGIPLILTVTVSAQIEEGQGKGWEKGTSGTGEIEMSTSVLLKGQYY